MSSGGDIETIAEACRRARETMTDLEGFVLGALVAPGNGGTWISISVLGGGALWTEEEPETAE